MYACKSSHCTGEHSKKFVPDVMQIHMERKNCVVIGANSGIAYSTAEGLASCRATVYMVCRNKQRGEAALAKIQSNTSNPSIHLEEDTHLLSTIISSRKHAAHLLMRLSVMQSQMPDGDPNFVNVTEYVNDMLLPTYAEKVEERIFDNATFDLRYYSNKWIQLSDHGTSHVSIVDSECNAVSFTSTINLYFGAGLMSPATCIIANNEMCDFATPTDETKDDIPPAPTNFIEPNKKPLSSMSPLIILKENNLAGVIGASGGMNIIPAIALVLINHFILGMDPLKAVQYPRFYHRYTPNVVLYENYTAVNGENFMFPEAAIKFLEERHHQLEMKAGVADVCQFVVQNLTGSGSSNANMKIGGHFRRMLTAVSDPRKDGSHACV